MVERAARPGRLSCSAVQTTHGYFVQTDSLPGTWMRSPSIGRLVLRLPAPPWRRNGRLLFQRWPRSASPCNFHPLFDPIRVWPRSLSGGRGRNTEHSFVIRLERRRGRAGRIGGSMPRFVRAPKLILCFRDLSPEKSAPCLRRCGAIRRCVLRRHGSDTRYDGLMQILQRDFHVPSIWRAPTRSDAAAHC